jgi:hypothetical protein
LNGREIIQAPSEADFLSILGVDESQLRRFPDSGSGNAMCVVDQFGLFFLFSSAKRDVMLFGLHLENPRWRPASERDPKNCFTGDLFIDSQVVNLPVTKASARIIERVNFTTVSLRLTPQGSSIASVLVSFLDQGARPFERN